MLFEKVMGGMVGHSCDFNVRMRDCTGEPVDLRTIQGQEATLLPLIFGVAVLADAVRIGHVRCCWLRE